MNAVNVLPRFAPLFCALLVTTFWLAACGGDYTSQVSKITGKTRYLNPNAASTKTQGFESVHIDQRGVLTVALKEKISAPEFEAPIVQRREVTGKRANPIGSTLAATFTIGLYPLLAPTNFLKDTFGHETSTQILSEEPDRDRAVATGRSEWVILPLKSAQIEISGLGTTLTREIQLDAQGSGSIDLGKELFDRFADTGNLQRLSIVCKNCVVNASISGPLARTPLEFTVPESWRLLTEYRRSPDLVWVADTDLIGNRSRKAASNRSRTVAWKDITAAAQKRGETQMQRIAEMPEALRRERRDIEASRPPLEVTLTRDEFESTAEFNERVRITRASEEAKLAAYDRRIESLNRKLREFQDSLPKTLPRPLVLQSISESLYELVGEPEVKNVVYDADLKRFIIKVAGSMQPDRAPVTFTMVTQDDIDADQGRRLKQLMNRARPFLRMSVSDKFIRPLSGHLMVGDQVLAMQFIDNVEIAALDTVKLEAGQMANLRPLPKIESGRVSTQLLVPSDDIESRKLRERLDELRDDVRQRQQASAEKERLNEEIRQLETRLKTMDQGDFKDDLTDVIAKISPAQVTGNTYAVVIGIADYDELPRVTFADRSAKSFADLLRKQFGIPPEHLVSLMNDEATGVRMMTRLRAMVGRMTNKDRLIVYYSGHAAPTRDGKHTVLIPQDASDGSLDDPAFRLNEFYQTLLRSNAQQIVVVLDTCFSGRSEGNKLIYKDVAPVIPVSRDGLTPPADTRLTVLAAGGPSDFANALRGRGHRLFSYHLLHEMAKTGSLTPDRFSMVSDAVQRDAIALGPDYRQKPLWLGKIETVKP
ncbi:MAG: caspase family protein [Oxalobacteraceae bacterium]|nr:caspase family protein [Oxalobacteraceae bacterium]